MEAQHPGLRSVLDAVRSGRPLSDSELAILESQLRVLRAGAANPPSAPEPQATERCVPALPGSMLTGGARADGTAAYAAAGPSTAGFYRVAQGLSLSSIGIGTYRGEQSAGVDAAYIAALRYALTHGVNVIDTSLNYRRQRSEVCVGAALRHFVESEHGRRDGVLVASKGGFLVPGALPRHLPFADEIVGGAHCLAPSFLADQLDRSRRNLGLDVIDVYYLHNPETQARVVDPRIFASRITRAFEYLEYAADEGLIGWYGIATWDGFASELLSLPTLAAIARRVGGERHRFRFVELPLSLGLLDTLPALDGGVLREAPDLGITVFASAALMQGRVSRDLPPWITRAMPGLSDAQRAIQFVRSIPSLTSALVGMRDGAHVRENLDLSAHPPLTTAEYRALLD
ncbi:MULTISPECIES: aldo/keto reductase [unclassified Nocardia]|uniref:aldo/keto reductase n=1 Tax=unclassified Nocardia TaxID=2637762 RepID=UPI001CE44DDB|nr:MULTISPECIES: aldo/keto reductase [unclassified Nocardia]